MKSLRTILLTGAAIALLGGTAFAQGSGSTQRPADVPGKAGASTAPGLNKTDGNPPGQTMKDTNVPPGHTFNTPGNDDKKANTTGSSSRENRR